MKKILLAFVLAIVMSIGLVGCGGASEPSNDSSASNASEESSGADIAEDAPTKTYESVMIQYASELQDATPVLMERYYQAAPELNAEAKAQLATDITTELAKICDDGIAEFAQIQLANGDAQSVYDDWASRLQAIYEQQVQLITEAYTATIS